MKTISKKLLLFIFSSLLSVQVFANCFSDEFTDQMRAIIGVGTSLFTSAQYVERTDILDGRRILQFKELDPGVPKFHNLPSNAARDVREILDNGGSNLDLMKAGYAPIGPDGKQFNIHHLYGEEPGPVAEIAATTHQKETKLLHHMIDESFRHDKTKRKSWRDFYKEYWKERAKGFN